MTPLLSRDKMTRGNPIFFHVDFLACLKSVFPHTPEKCKSATYFAANSSWSFHAIGF